MISQALLEAVETAGKDELAQLQQETRQRIEAILATAEETAESRRETAYKEVLRPVATERARRLHEAQMEALKITAAAHDQIAEKLLAQIENRLRTLRDQPYYKGTFNRFVEEAMRMLGQEELAGNHQSPAEPPRLEVDVRDETLAEDIVQTLPVKMEIVPELETWGGVVVRSGDGRIAVTNTLESRLEQLKPHLGTFIS